MEGPWIAKEPLRVGFQSVDLRDAEERMEEAMGNDMGQDTGYKDMFGTKYAKGSQVDNGPICMMQYRAARERRTRRRSHSQPPPICRRAEEGQHGPRWLPRYHHCPSDSKWEFRCRHERVPYYEPDIGLRSCVQGILDGPFSAQEGYSWQCWSFLAEISHCQDGEPDPDRYFRDRGILHTGTEDCPWNCKTVDLAGLKVPDPLKPYHPTKKSSAYEKYRVG